MASSNDSDLWNDIPVDHRLKRFLPLAQQKHFHEVGEHVEFIEKLGNDMVRDDGSTPTKHETAFAAWLAKPDMTGGLAIALQQPAKSQIFTADVRQVKDECKSLAYLDRALAFLNGPAGVGTTSVFDAFPFITEQISSGELTIEATRAYDTFLSMLEAKRPKILFACWRIYGRKDSRFSGQGPGRTDVVKQVQLSNGHIVRVVNGLHPSYIANFFPNESCFRKLFALELCKAFCELNTAWQEESWMADLRKTCRERASQLGTENSRVGERLNMKPKRELRSNTAYNTTKNYQAYKRSFDKGLKELQNVFEHMTSSAYATQSSWDLYKFFVVDQQKSESICDVLLAVSEAMNRFATNSLNLKNASEDLGKYVSDQVYKFLENDTLTLVSFKQGKQKEVWSSRFPASRSRGLKQSMESITINFVEKLSNTFSKLPSGWTYTPDLLYGAFKELAIDFEDALGREYTNHREPTVLNPSSGIDELDASLRSLSISKSQTSSMAKRTTRRSPRKSSSSDECFACGRLGHWSGECFDPKGKDLTSPLESALNNSCYSCGQADHWKSSCPIVSKSYDKALTSSDSSSAPKCSICNQLGHTAWACPSHRSREVSMRPRTISSGNCFNCGEYGHWSANCSRAKQHSTTPSRSKNQSECFACRKTGHWAKNCPTGGSR